MYNPCFTADNLRLAQSAIPLGKKQGHLHDKVVLNLFSLSDGCLGVNLQLCIAKSPCPFL